MSLTLRVWLLTSTLISWWTIPCEWMYSTPWTIFLNRARHWASSISCREWLRVSIHWRNVTSQSCIWIYKQAHSCNKEFFINVGLVHYDEKSEYNQLPTFQDGSLEQQKCISLNSGYKITNLTIHSKSGWMLVNCIEIRCVSRKN